MIRRFCNFVSANFWATGVFMATVFCAVGGGLALVASQHSEAILSLPQLPFVALGLGYLAVVGGSVAGAVGLVDRVHAQQ